MGEWNTNKARGNIGENIIEMLINSMPNWKCVRFGVENHIEEVKEMVRADINSLTKKIKSMPDFIAHNTKTEETFFVEVKYRSYVDRRDGKSEIKIDFLEEYPKYWGRTILIIVHPNEPHFFVIDLNKIENNMCRKEQVDVKKWDYYWDFVKIQKGIQDLFPDLKENIIKEAIKLIPSKI